MSQALAWLVEAPTRMASAPTHWMLRLAPLLALPAILFAANAHAQPSISHKVRLEVVHGPGAEACPDEAVVRHAILVSLKDDPFSPATPEDPFSPAAKASLRVVFSRAGREFQSSFELRDDAGKLILARTLPKHSECAVAVEDVGLSVGVHMPPLVTAPTPAPAAPPPLPSPLPPPLPPPSPLPSPSPSPSPPPSPSPSTAGRVEAPRPPPTKVAEPIVGRFDIGALVSVGTAPAPAFGLSAHVGARWSFVSASLGGRYEATASDGTETVRVSAWRWLMEAVPCLHWRIAFGCGLVQIGELTARGQDPDFVGTFTALSVSVGSRFGVEWPLSIPLLLPRRLAAYLAVDLTGAAKHPDISFDPEVEWNAPHFTGAAGAGVVFLF